MTYLMQVDSMNVAANSYSAVRYDYKEAKKIAKVMAKDGPCKIYVDKEDPVIRWELLEIVSK